MLRFLVLTFIEMKKIGGVAEYVPGGTLGDKFILWCIEFKMLVEYRHPDTGVDRQLAMWVWSPRKMG